MIEQLWNAIRPPKRLTQYGTLALHIFDDRTLLEKLCDKVDNWIFEYRQRQRLQKSIRKQVWHSFYSMSLGGIVDSPQKIRDWEKKGYAWATAREFEETANKAQKRIEQESKKKIREKVEYAARQIAQGRSYIKEQREMIEKARRGQ